MIMEDLMPLAGSDSNDGENNVPVTLSLRTTPACEVAGAGGAAGCCGGSRGADGLGWALTRRGGGAEGDGGRVRVLERRRALAFGEDVAEDGEGSQAGTKGGDHGYGEYLGDFAGGGERDDGEGGGYAGDGDG